MLPVKRNHQHAASTIERAPGIASVGKESVPKIIINATKKLFLNCNQHSGNFKP